MILFAPEASGPIFRIPATGGTPEPVTTLDASKKEYGHRFPLFLPDGDHFLFASLPGKAGKFDISVGSLKDKSRTFVGALESSPVYADPGWLLYVRQGVLAAQAFDLNTRTLSGDPHPLEDEPTSILDPAISFTANRPISVSVTGALAFYSTPSMNTTATWYDSNGRSAGTLDVPAGHYETATISPDGTRAIFVRSTSPSESTLWLVNLARGGAIPLSTGPGRNDWPVWSPDGKRVAFASDRDGPENFYVKTVDDATPEQMLYQSDVLFKNPAAWSSDGQWITLTQLEAGTAQDIVADARVREGRAQTARARASARQRGTDFTRRQVAGVQLGRDRAIRGLPAGVSGSGPAHPSVAAGWRRRVVDARQPPNRLCGCGLSLTLARGPGIRKGPARQPAKTVRDPAIDDGLGGRVARPAALSRARARAHGHRIGHGRPALAGGADEVAPCENKLASPSAVRHDT